MGKQPRSVVLNDLVVAPDEDLRRVLQVIDRCGLEVALVCDQDRRLRAVITDGDVRRALLRDECFDIPASAIGTADFIATDPDATRADALQVMVERSIKCLPVVDADGALVDLHTIKNCLTLQHCDSWAVVMAGGLGTRLGELTDGTPKPMLPVGDRPILQHIVEHLVSHGIRRIFLSVNYLASQVEEWFGDGSGYHCRIDYLREDRPLGTGGALALLPERPLAPLVVMNGDLFTRINIARMLAFHRAGDFRATMALREHDVTVPFGVAEVDGSRVSRLVEKPKLSYRINAGIYTIDPVLLDDIDTERLFPITELFAGALARDERIGAYHMQEQWVDIGVPEQFRSVQGP